MKEILNVICIGIGMCLVSMGIIYLVDKDSKVCDTAVIMKDDRIYECAETNTYSGLTRICGCDGNWIEVPTADIRIIQKIEKK